MEKAKKKKSGWKLILTIFSICILAVGGSVFYLHNLYRSLAFVSEAEGKNRLSINVWVPESPNKPIIEAISQGKERVYRGKNPESKGAFKVYVHDHRSGKVISSDSFAYTKSESGFNHVITLTKSGCLKSCSWHWQPFFQISKTCRFVFESGSCEKL